METPTQFISRIISNDRISEGFFELSLSWDPRAPVPMPGQFMTVRVGSLAVPLLRRPFAFAGFDADSSSAAIIYQKRGAGTELLAAARPGDELDVIGPLGTPFVIDTDQSKHVIIAGGIGLGPMLFLSSALKSRNIPARFIFGCRNKSLVPDTKMFTDADPQICTDDGSAGFRGTVADYINTNVSLDNSTTIYACGPSPMLTSVNKIAQSSGARCQVSLEAVMACGVGACMGCAVPVVGGGYARVCKEGPVFDGGEVLWERM
ncbi:MAG: dihydroorotate dehydrogenase electron transfer subunit [Chitinispirillales bacterium]|nr:dihydroorotate dehydrogenase electron transfer subunit [Chitinispirillales bacterium]